MPNLIEIKHLTFVINLKINFAMNYLEFIDELKEIKKTDSTNCLSSMRKKRDYLVLYIEPSPCENKVINPVVKSLIKNKIKCIAIDELFSNDNEFILQSKKIPTEAKWATKRNFDKTASYIEVK